MQCPDERPPYHFCQRRRFHLGLHMHYNPVVVPEPGCTSGGGCSIWGNWWRKRYSKNKKEDSYRVLDDLIQKHLIDSNFKANYCRGREELLEIYQKCSYQEWR